MIRKLLILFALALFAPCAFAQTKPANDLSLLQKWFRQLNDRDPEVRDTARTQLMGIPRSRLDDLQTVVRESRPLSAAQTVELRQIVSHVFLTGQPYPVDRGGQQSGFLGVRLAVVTLPDSGNDEVNVSNPEQRVVIASRLPGFGAFPILRDGDVVERIYIDNRRGIVPHDDREFSRIISAMDTGRMVDMEVQRAGKLVRVAVKLAPRPGPADAQQQSTEFFQQRDNAAAEYWDQTFGKLLNQRTAGIHEPLGASLLASVNQPFDGS